MKYVVVVAAYNEEDFISHTLDSLMKQTHLPHKVIVVDDNSSDKTSEIVQSFCQKYSQIELVLNSSKGEHQPGSKVIQAFLKGFNSLQIKNIAYDFIVKLDADLLLPSNYFQKISDVFHSDASVGMAGGFAYIEKNNQWVLENLTDNDHIRGAFKAYRKECFQQIGGLKPAMGWDTLDELLCRFYNWKIVTLKELKVKHLKPTGFKYNNQAALMQGKAFYQLGYGFNLTLIASLKLGIKKRKLNLFLNYIKGYFKSKKANEPLLVTQEQARFVKKYRWRKIKYKMFKFIKLFF